MGNKIKFTMKNVPDGLSQINSAVLDTNYNKLWSGIQAVSGADVELDIGTAGTVGNGVWVYGDNASVGSESTAKVFGGYSLIEADPVVPPTGLLIEGDRLKVIAFGDSITDQGDSDRRNSSTSTSYQKTTRGWWCSALSVANQDFCILDGVGVSSDTTVNLLARMDDVLLTDADIVMLMIGTNDLNENRTPSDIALNVADILDQIIVAGKKVIIQPTIKRRPDTPQIEEWNLKVDELNAAYRVLADERPNSVAVASDATDYNQLLVDNPALVTGDGTHPIAYGGWVIGSSTAATLTEKVLSRTPVDDVNYVSDFSGSTGTLLNGATGTVPDNWKLHFANPADGVGGTVNLDNSFTVRTGLSSGANENQSKVSISANVPEGEYIFSVDLTISDINKLNRDFSILLRESNYLTNSEFLIPKSTELAENSASFQNAKFTTGIIHCTTGTLVVDITGDSLVSEQIEYTLSNPRLVKVG